MLERQLTRLLRVAVRRAAAERSIAWGIIVASAYLLRRALRDDDAVRQLRVRPGEDLVVTVRDQAS